VHHHRGSDAGLSAFWPKPAVKRSSTIRLVLLGGISAGAMATSADVAPPQRAPANVYVNDYHVQGAGYYHAPFQAFYGQPYNFYDPVKKLYFYGGQWGPEPHRSIVNISNPTPEAALVLETIQRNDAQRARDAAIAAAAARRNSPTIIGVPRSGFGSTSHSFSSGSS
jgi:hypothetical protein